MDFYLVLNCDFKFNNHGSTEFKINKREGSLLAGGGKTNEFLSLCRKTICLLVHIY